MALVLLFLTSCADAAVRETTTARRAHPIVSAPAEVDACDESDLRAALGDLEVEVKVVEVRVPVGEPAETLARCLSQEPLAQCERRLLPSSSGRHAELVTGTNHVSIRAAFTVDGAREERLFRNLGERDEWVRDAEAHGRVVELGRTMPEPTAQGGAACVRVWRTVPVTVARATLEEAPPLEVPDSLVVALAGGGRWTVRCRSAEEAPVRSPIASDGPCAELSEEVQRQRALATVSCDTAPDITRLGVIPGAEGFRLYGIRRFSFWGLFGIENGDELVSACGERGEQALEALEAAPSSYPSGCEFELVRRGERMFLDVDEYCERLRLAAGTSSQP